MKRRALVAALTALVLGLAPAARAHTWWDVYDTCDINGSLYFYPGGPAQWWYFHQTPAATNGCHLYTTIASQVYNYADWYLPTQECTNTSLPNMGNHNDGRCYNEKKYTGTYQMLAYLIRESHFSTRKAHYIRYPFSLVKGGTSHFVDQGAAATGNKLVVTGWIDTRLDDGNAGFMRVNDYSTEPSGSKYVGVDRMYFHNKE